MANSIMNLLKQSPSLTDKFVYDNKILIVPKLVDCIFERLYCLTS